MTFVGNVKGDSIMSVGTLERIETELDSLTEVEQLSLLERLARRLNDRASRRACDVRSELAAMAGDPEIQRELDAIDQEFRATQCLQWNQQ